MGIIPEKVKNEVLDARAKDDANDCLFEHLCSQATLADLRNLCSIMKEAKGYSKMIGFGETLQAELDKVRNCSDWQTMWKMAHIRRIQIL